MFSDRPSFSVDAALSDPQFIQMAGMGLTLKPQTLRSDLVDTHPAAFVLNSVSVAGLDTPVVYPQVVVRKLAEGKGAQEPLDPQRLLDENDLDRNGILDAKGVDYTGDGVPDRLVILATLDLDTDTKEKLKTPGHPDCRDHPEGPPAAGATATDALPGSKPTPVTPVPSGRYSITLVQSTGQTWRVPNDYIAISPPTDAASLAVAQTQTYVIEVK